MEPFDVADRKKRGGTVKAPFPYFGGKSAVADVVWRRFGSVNRYIEPFFGSGAVLLSQPANANRTELVNDVNCFVVNFWRAVQHDPEAVVRYAANPINEIDYHARHMYLHGNEKELRRELESNPYTFNAELAGWWVWGQSIGIGKDWARKSRLLSMPSLSRRGQKWVGGDVLSDILALRDRLENTVVLCGDWKRCVVSDSALNPDGCNVGIFLDPPYSAAKNGRANRVYAHHDSGAIADDVVDWCKRSEIDPRLRIALCGYVGDYDLPGWTEHRWATNGGYANQGDSVGRSNKKLEVVYFSPSCSSDGLFD